MNPIYFYKLTYINFSHVSKNYVVFNAIWKDSRLHSYIEYGSAEDNVKIASYLNKGIYDECLPRGRKRYLGGYDLKRPVHLKFTSRKIIDFLLTRNGKIVIKFESLNGFMLTALVTDATIDELENFALAENEELTIEHLEKLQSIQPVFVEEDIFYREF